MLDALLCACQSASWVHRSTPRFWQCVSDHTVISFWHTSDIKSGRNRFLGRDSDGESSYIFCQNSLCKRGWQGLTLTSALGVHAQPPVFSLLFERLSNVYSMGHHICVAISTQQPANIPQNIIYWSCTYYLRSLSKLIKILSIKIMLYVII